MFNILLWGLLIVVGIPAIIIAILAIAVCLSYKKLDEEREGKYEDATKNSTDG